MRIDYEYHWEDYMLLLCMFKVFKDAGNEFLDFGSEYVVINDFDYYFEYCLEHCSVRHRLLKKVRACIISMVIKTVMTMMWI